MPDVDEINSNLGALEAQLEELSRLRGLVQSLSEREEAANEAVEAAERASVSSREVIEKFEDATTRIEGAEVVERFEEIGDTIQRFEEAGSDLKDHVETLPEVLKEPLIEYHRQMEEDLSEALSAFGERLDEAGDNLSVLQNALEKRLDRHHSEITDTLSSAQEERDQTAEKLEEIDTEVGQIDELLQEAQLKNRLETLQDTASNANQAAQNGLSRIDSAQRSLSDTLDEHQRRQERRADKIEEKVGDLRDQLRGFVTFTRRLLWALLVVASLILVLGGTVVYIAELAP